jgi:hypothetical protein
MTYQRVALKVCEGCGTLWIRNGVGVYCGPCENILRDFPDPKTRLRPGRPKKVRGEGTYGGMVPALACSAVPVMGGAL